MKHKSVIEMLKSMDVDWEEIEQHIHSRKIVTQLMILRAKSGLSQEHLAIKVGRPVSKIEEGTDNELSASDLMRYCTAIGAIVEIK